MKSCKNCGHLYVNKDAYYDCIMTEKDDNGFAKLSLCFNWISKIRRKDDKDIHNTKRN